MIVALEDNCFVQLHVIPSFSMFGTKVGIQLECFSKTQHKDLRDGTHQATSCSDKSLCVYWRIFVSTTEFCHSIKSHRISQIEFVQHFAATEFCCEDKNFCRNSPVHTKWFVAVAWCITCCPTCTQGMIFHHDLLQGHVLCVLTVGVYQG